MIKNTPNECMGSQPLWKKFLIALKILKNPWQLFLDKAGFVKDPVYQTTTGLAFQTRGKTTDVNDAVVVLSGNEYPRELLGIEGKQNPVVFDCGGHIGTFSLYVKQIYPMAKIVAFEPVENNRVLFQKNMGLNSFTDVTLVPNAIYGEAGQFYIDLSGKQFDAVSVQQEKPAHDEYIEINAITFAEAVSTYNIQKIDLLKLDVEGSEYNIFEKSMSDLTNHVKRLIMEYHPAGDKAKRDEIANRFQQAGWHQIYETKNILGFENPKYE